MRSWRCQRSMRARLHVKRYRSGRAAGSLVKAGRAETVCRTLGRRQRPRGAGEWPHTASEIEDEPRLFAMRAQLMPSSHEATDRTLLIPELAHSSPSDAAVSAWLDSDSTSFVCARFDFAPWAASPPAWPSMATGGLFET